MCWSITNSDSVSEKEAIALCLKMGENIPLITDDRLAYIVSDRMRVQKLLLLDLVVELVTSMAPKHAHGCTYVAWNGYAKQQS